MANKQQLVLKAGVFPATKAELDTALRVALEQFFDMFHSYNPCFPMGPGMAAEFRMRQSQIEYLKHTLQHYHG